MLLHVFLCSVWLFRHQKMCHFVPWFFFRILCATPRDDCIGCIVKSFVLFETAFHNGRVRLARTCKQTPVPVVAIVPR